MGVMRARGYRRLIGGGRKMFTENNYALPLCYYRSESSLENGGADTTDELYFTALPSFVIGGLRIAWNKLSITVIVQFPDDAPAEIDLLDTTAVGYLALLREVGHGYECSAPGFEISSHVRDDGYYLSDYEGIRPRRDATLYKLNNVYIPTNWVLEEVIEYKESGGTFYFDGKLPGEYKILFLKAIPADSTVTVGIQSTE